MHIGTCACPARFNIGLSNAVIILVVVKEKYSMQSTIKKLQEKAPELLKEIPELPSFVSFYIVIQ
jgi:hypothetical protein